MNSSKNNVEVRKDKVQELFKNYYNPRQVIIVAIAKCTIAIKKQTRKVYIYGYQFENGIMETT